MQEAVTISVKNAPVKTAPIETVLAKTRPVAWLIFALLLALTMAGMAYRLANNLPSLTSNQVAQLQIEAGSGQSDSAFRQLQQAAMRGQAEAQYGFGMVLLNRGDDTAGINWLEKAAAQEQAQAEFNLGKLYLLGDRPKDQPAIDKNYQSAFDWLSRAAKHGQIAAHYYLGLMYKSGYGRAVDFAQAVKHFQYGAAQQQPASLFMLANAYRYGEGVPQNNRLALQYYQQAADLEHPEAIQTLAMAYQNGEMGLKTDKAQFYHQQLEVAHALKHPAPIP